VTGEIMPVTDELAFLFASHWTYWLKTGLIRFFNITFGLNIKTFRNEMVIVSPVCGFLPVLSAFCRTTKSL
jgi:hypothetical protein